MRPPRPAATQQTKGDLNQIVFIQNTDWSLLAMSQYTHDHHPVPCQCKHMQANTSTADYSRSIVTFVSVLHQATALTGGGKLPSELTDPAAQTELLICLQNVAYGPHISLLLWVISGPVIKFSHRTNESHMNPQTALYQTTPFHEGHFRCSWSMSPYLPSVSFW